MPLAASPKLCRTLVAASVCLGSMGLATIALAQGTPEQQKACTPDALRLCSAEIPDVPKTTACMRAHLGELSPACRAAFPAAASPPAEKKRSRREAAEPKPKPARPRERAAMVIRPDVTRPRPRSRLAEGPATRAPETRVAPAKIPLTRIAPAPIAPTPAAPDPFGLAVSRAQLARACGQGLIDPYTCRTTIPALYGRQ